MKDSRERFTDTVENYRRYRPGYPPELIDWIVRESGAAPGARVVDVGCGTGIVSRIFTARGFDVLGVDPNPAMLAAAEREGGARYAHGEAAATSLPDASAGLIVSGQAFHWFDVPPTLRELRRILAPGGACAAFWNVRDSTPLLDEYRALLDAYAPEHRELRGPEAALAALEAAPSLTNRARAEFRQVQTLDREGFFGRAYSSSYVVHGLIDKPGFDRALAELFERRQSGGRVEFAYRSIALLWRFP